VAAVGRLHPRHWDGHRLLQFLTGLALLALAFGTTAASAAPASPPAAAVTTTVEAPADPAVDIPAAPAATTVEAPTAAAAAAVDIPAAAAAAAAVRDDAPLATSRRFEECQHDVGRAAYAVSPAADAAALAGVAQQAHGSRAPPR
jgi:hypothetical protein